MTHPLKRLVSSLLVLAIWIIPSVEGFAAPVPVAGAAPVPPSSPISSVPEDRSTFAELFPFGAIAAAEGWAQEAANNSDGSLASYEARELQSPELQDFRGGGVSIYIGSTALLIVVIILLVILF